MSIFSANAQKDMHLLKQTLGNLGFENVCAVDIDDTIFVSLEPTSFRGTFRGPAEALKCIKSICPSSSHVELSVHEYGVPRVCVHALCEVSDRWNVSVDYDVVRVEDKLKNDHSPSKNNYGKIDVNLIPIVTLDNHQYDRLYYFGVFFAPSFETTLWKGNRIIVQPIIPVCTNLDEYDTHKYTRLGVAAISQELFFKGKWTGKLSAGAFYPDAVGVYGDFKYKLNPYIDFGAYVGYAYTSLFYDKKWYIGKSTMLDAMLKFSVYDPWSSFQFEMQGGRFNFGDWGVRADLTRHFGEYAIGLYGILTGGEHNGGFHFAIPFGGKKQNRKGFVRVKAPDYYDMQYSMVSYLRYTWQRMGRELEEIPDKNHSAHYWQAEYIEKYTQRYLDGTFE